MTEASTRDAAQDTITIAGDTMGHDFVAALLAELRQMPDHWARLAEDKQQQIIERIKTKVRDAVTKAQGAIMRAGFAAVPADLESVTFKNGLTANLKIPKDALHRHEFADAQGSRVLVVIADADRWLNRMDEIKAKGDQIDLFDADYDPARDQPGYRRDQDRIAAAGPTWADLKASLSKPKEEPPAASPPEQKQEATPSEPPPAEGGELVFGSALTPEQEAVAKLGVLQEQLASVGCVVSLGALQAFNEKQIAATGVWVEAYAAAPDSCKIARPLWLPIPDRGPTDATE